MEIGINQLARFRCFEEDDTLEEFGMVFNTLIDTVYKNWAIFQQTVSDLGREHVEAVPTEMTGMKISIVSSVDYLIRREILLRSEMYPLLTPNEIDKTLVLAEEKSLYELINPVRAKMTEEYYDTNPALLRELLESDDPEIDRLSEFCRFYPQDEMTTEAVIDRVKLKIKLYEGVSDKEAMHRYLCPERFALYLYDLAEKRREIEKDTNG
jgi:hypothetical protein